MRAGRAQKSRDRVGDDISKPFGAAPLMLAGALVLLAGVLLAAGCGGPATIEAAESDSGNTIEASVGDVIKLSLPENPTTGYEWKLDLSGGLKRQKTDYVPDDKSGELSGSGGTRTWWIEVTGAGEQTIGGAYQRPWEPDDPQAQKFILTITAK